MARFLPPTHVQHYPVQPGLFAGEYPGSDHSGIAVERLQQLAEEGITTFIDLTTAEDAALGLAPYDHYLPQNAASGPKLIHHRFPIPDMGIPEGQQTMREILQLIRSEIDTGRTCYVHCWGGIGRTGTAVACWLVENGATPDEALVQVQSLYEKHMSEEKRARYPNSPQQPRQLDYVRAWAPGLSRNAQSANDQPPA